MEKQIKALKEKNRLLDNILSTHTDFMYLFDINRRFTYVNKSLLDLWGLSLEDAVGKNFWDLKYPDELAAKLDKEIAQALAGQTVRGETPYTNHERKTGYYEYIFVPVRDEESKITAVFGTTRDISELKDINLIANQAKEAIQNERENFRNLFKQTPEMVCILSGPDHVFEFVNDAHIKALGFDATGKPVRVAQPESVEVHGILDEVYNTGKTAELFEIPVTLTDRVRYFNLTYAARRNAEGQINGIMIIGLEVTDSVLARQILKNKNEALEIARQALQESEARLRYSQEQLKLAVDVAKVGFYDWDIKNDKIIFSEQMKKDWGVEARPLSSLSDAFSFIHPDDRARVSEAIQTSVHQRVPYQTEYRVIKANGDIVWLSVRGEVHRNEQDVPTRFFGTSVVITEQKEKEESLRQAQWAAEKANAAKGIFLANMSHEIRTPLGAIMGFLDLIKNPQNTDADIQEYIGVIDRNSKQLLRIVDDVLDLSKIEAGKLQIESVRFSLSELLMDFTSLMSFKAREKGLLYELHLSSSIPDQVSGDPTRLRQILSNVVGNAIKFTDRGRIIVNVNFVKEILRISVEDTGCGIAEETVQNLFQPFSQADNSVTRLYGGTGLGLALTRKLTEALGGNFILQKSVVGQGSTFVATVHLKTLESSKMIQASELEFVSKPVHVESKQEILSGFRALVVDDSVDNQALMQILLKYWGAGIELATNGKEAIEKAMSEDFDVVLMDVQMPIMDGHEATQMLRKAGYAKPIVALTAHAMREEEDRCKQSGFSGFLSKPINKDILIKTLMSYRKMTD